MALFEMSVAEARELKRLESRVNTWRGVLFGEILSDLASVGAKQMKNRIVRERRSPDGQQWLPRKDKKPHPLLNKSGDMMNSITAIRQGTAEVRVVAFSKYAMFHQHGVLMKLKRTKPRRPKVGPRERAAKFAGPRKWRLPPRPFMGLSDENLRDLDKRLVSLVGSRLQ